MFQKAKWIWINSQQQKDEYGHFKTSIPWKNGDVLLNISCDGNFVVYVNGGVGGFGQYPDYPNYKIYQQINITPFLKQNEVNTIEILVWHYGIEGTQTYYPAQAGLIFEIINNDQVIDYSQINTLSKLHDNYISYEEKIITRQLGLSFAYDARNIERPFSESSLVEKSYLFYKKPIEDFDFNGRLATTKIVEDKHSAVFDLGRQSVGFLELDIYSPKDQKITITFGENLVENAVQHLIDDRDFSVSYYAKEGHNQFSNYLLKFGCRYLQIYYEEPIRIHYLGLNEIVYPVKLNSINHLELTDLRKNIYDVSIQTLKNCMLEHYVDCPWREQALYTLDSRNQMLCGYFTFNNYAYARANLVLISKGLREDGLLDICFPSYINLTIPYYSLVYLVQIYEYIQYSADETILEEVFPQLKIIMENFLSKIDHTQLIPDFDYPFWNFYEWSEGSHHDNEIMRATNNQTTEKNYSLILNTYFLYAMQHYKYLCQMVGEDVSFFEQPMIQAINHIFFDEDRHLYKLDTQSFHYSVLGNSLAVLSGVADTAKSETILEILTGVNNLIPITLSMKGYFYDALLKNNADYREYVLNDLDNDYGYMLNHGATTFWETILGKEDFNGAGSLCHGWSAMPVYYYHRLLVKE